MPDETSTGKTEDTLLQIHVVNHGGQHCDIALKAVTRFCDLPAIASWRSTNGNEHGNCFFATTHAALDLVKEGLVEDCYLMTGRFDHEDLPEPVYHAWLEFRNMKPWVVVNLSMLHERPLYAADRDAYYEMNACRKIIQEIPLRRLQIKAAQMSQKAMERTGHPGFDIRDFTHKLLKPTIGKLPALQTAPRET